MEEEREDYGSIMSPEIVEIREDSRRFAREATTATMTSRDVYVAVGKDDVNVLKWPLDHLVAAGGRVFLVHVFPPITQVPVDTMLIGSNATAKAILYLIPVLNITNLVMGTKKSLYPRLLMKKLTKGEYVRKNAPEYCEVSIVWSWTQKHGRTRMQTIGCLREPLRRGKRFPNIRIGSS